MCNEHYERAMDPAELLKLRLLTAISEKEVRAKTEANWFLDDMEGLYVIINYLHHGDIILFSAIVCMSSPLFFKSCRIHTDCKLNYESEWNEESFCNL